MEELSKTIEAAAALAKAVPVYQDLAQPLAQELGKAGRTLGELINLALTPFQVVVWGAAQIKEYLQPELERMLADVPVECVKSPPWFVAGPAIEALRFCAEEPNLRRLYAKLIATAMDKRTVQRAHPAFVEVIKGLTPDEARVMQVFRSTQRVSCLITEYTYAGSELPQQSGCTHPELMRLYLSNLERAGLLEISVADDERIESHPELSSLVDLPEVQHALAESRAASPESELKAGVLYKSDLGDTFVLACMGK